MRGSIVGCFLIVGCLCSAVLPQRSPAGSRFRYLLVRDTSDVQRKVNEDAQSKFLEVLLDDGAFTEKNLNQLFQLLANRYPAPVLHIYVYTTLNAIRTPEEWDRTDLWGPVEGYQKFKHAVFIRDGDGERFTYSIPGVVEAKEIRIKGVRGLLPGRNTSAEPNLRQKRPLLGITKHNHFVNRPKLPLSHNSSTQENMDWKFHAAGRQKRWEEFGPYGANTYKGEQLYYDADGRDAKRGDLTKTRISGVLGGWNEVPAYKLYSSVTGKEVQSLTSNGSHYRTHVYVDDMRIADECNGTVLVGCGSQPTTVWFRTVV